MLVYRNVPFLIISSIVFLGLCIVQVGALVRQTGSNLSPWIKKLTWVGLALVVFSFVESYAEMMYLFFSSVDHTKPVNQMTYFKMYAEMNPFDHPVILILDIIFAVALIILGLWGHMLLKKRAKT